MPMTTGELARKLGAELFGDANQQLTSVASLSAARESDLVFVEADPFLDAALASSASAILAGDFARRAKTPKSLLIVSEPRLAFARAAPLIAPYLLPAAGVHPSAIVDKSARIAASASVGPFVRIGARCSIGERSALGAGVAIGENISVGDDCLLHANCVVYGDTQIGNRVIVHAGTVLGSDGFGFVRDAKTGRYEKFPQLGSLLIEDDVEIGANCTIDRGALDQTVIRRGTKLDNLVHIGHNAQIGTDVVIAAQTGVSGSSVIEDNVIVGGQVGIADHVRIEQGAILGAQSGIPSRKVIRGKGVVFWGTPARPIREYLKELAVLSRLAKRSE
jgi:UDP-3-O-[3-hydroxymyristoyl] glucosamine N-acyltransferase